MAATAKSTTGPISILGQKLRMTQIFDEMGRCIPVTIIQAGPCAGLQIKTEEKEGYSAIQVAFGVGRKQMPKARLVTTDGLEEAIRNVINGDADALVADRETCAFAVLRHPDAGLIDAEVTFTVEPMGIAVPLDEPRLANLVQTYLKALADRGTLERARQFWLKDPSWVKDLR